MKNRKLFFVSRKNILVWLMVACMVASAVTRIWFSGVKGAGESQHLWSLMILPTVSSLLFAAICLFSGREKFYKTAIPIWLIGLYYCFFFGYFGFTSFRVMIIGLYVIALLFVAIMYTMITGGKLAQAWLLIPLELFPIAAQMYLYRDQLSAGEYRLLIPDMLMILGCILTVFAMHPHTDGLYHPTWGDRSDGRRIRTLPPISIVTPYIMPDRQNASNLFSDSIEITKTERYIREKRREGYSNFGITHVLLAAYCRGVAKFPAINRFLSGQRIYSRDGDIQFCMTIKKEMTTQSPDTIIKLHLSPADTAIDVYNKMNAEVEKVHNTPLDSGFDNTAGVFSIIPGVVLKFTLWVIKTMDYFGLIPKFLLEISPFHASVFFTSMGSLGIPPVYHHLYDFGNLPGFCAFGLKRRTLDVQEDGSIVQHKYVDIKITTDERIVDGFYYATFFKYFKRLFRTPEILDQPPEEIVQDID